MSPDVLVSHLPEDGGLGPERLVTTECTGERKGLVSRTTSGLQPSYEATTLTEEVSGSEF